MSLKMEKKETQTSNSEIVCVKNGENMEEIIGQVPDEIVGVVFSHLTLKEAARTSVIARRWRHLWRLSPHFDFDASLKMDQIVRLLDSTQQESHKDVVERERSRYIRWVNQVVENHQGSCVHELVIIFDLDVKHSLHLDRWIKFAMRKRVKSIKIDLSPRFLESTERYSFLRDNPALYSVECLTSLCLKYVNINGERIEHLLSKCPLLERLCLEYSRDLLYLRVVGSSLKLKYLDISFCLWIKSIQICAPKLVSFHYRGLRPIENFEAKGLCCLVDSSIHFTDCSELVKFLSYFSHLKMLTLVFTYDESFMELLRLPQFINLKQLTFKILHLRHLCGLAEFINLCPYLHKFILELSIDLSHQEVPTEWGTLSPHQHLKVVEITGFVGRSYQIEIASFFLRSANCLEKLVIDTRVEISEMVGNFSKELSEALRREAPSGVDVLILA